MQGKKLFLDKEVVRFRLSKRVRPHNFTGIRPVGRTEVPHGRPLTLCVTRSSLGH